MATLTVRLPEDAIKELDDHALIEAKSLGTLGRYHVFGHFETERGIDSRLCGRAHTFAHALRVASESMARGMAFATTVRYHCRGTVTRVADMVHDS